MYHHPRRSNEHHRTRAIFAALTVLACSAAIATALPAQASAGTFEIDACAPYTTNSGVFQHAAAFGIGTYDNCGLAGVNDLLIETGPNAVPAGTTGKWYTEAPSGLRIVGVNVTGFADIGVDAGRGWGGGFFWPGGGASVYEGENAFSASMNTSFFAMQIVCGAATCNGAANLGALAAEAIRLSVAESGAPSITATSPLYGKTGWIRGNGWPLSFRTDDPSGVCHTQATVGSTVLQGGISPQNHTVYHVCSLTSFSQVVNTTEYPNGPLTIALQAYNAAGNWATPSTTVHVDNAPVQLSVSGPATASTTAGTQFVTARASGGPSGIAIGCSVDGGAVQWHAGATDQVPVAGAGVHVVSCRARNGAVDPQGQPAYSTTHSLSLNIGQPTVSTVGFTKIVDQLKCHRVRKRIKVKGGRVKSVTVQRCHPRIAWKRETVFVKVRRHGKTVTVKRTKRVRVVLTPHAVAKTKERVAFGHGATVSGWLGTVSTAIAGAPVHVLTAPNNGLNQFALAAATTTAANGSWSVKLPAGPSRLVEAVYAGSAGLLPASSTPVLLNVPARIRLSISPRAVLWRDAIRVSGHLVGGYVPPDGVALRLLVRYPGTKHPTTLRALRTNAAGRFRFNWSYHSGNGVITYPLSVATTAAETDYAFAPNHSRVIHITFGKQAPRHHRRRQRGP